MALEKLIRVDLREEWSDEAKDFTPWLAQPENLEILSEALDIELGLIGTEQKVGNYSADMLCKDTDSENYVLIENQLDGTNHKHLGQLLTYFAKWKNVKTVVWIAKSFTEEHKAALARLNNITGEEYGFFGLEVELWRIGDSAFAPKFNIVCRPNTFQKETRKGVPSNKELGDIQLQQLSYWENFKKFMEKKDSAVKCLAPTHTATYMLRMSRHRDFQLIARINSNDSILTVDFRIPTPPTNKALYFHFFNRKSDIEKEFGQTLTWDEKVGNKKSHVSISRKNTDFRNKDDWDKQFNWLADSLEKLNEVFHDRISVENLDIEAIEKEYEEMLEEDSSDGEEGET